MPIALSSSFRSPLNNVTSRRFRGIISPPPSSSLPLRDRAIQRYNVFPITTRRDSSTQVDARGNKEEWGITPYKGLSCVAGPTYPPLLEDTLGGFWRSLVNDHPDRPALVSLHEPPSTTSTSKHLRWTFQEMDSQVESLAHGLIEMGIEKGDRVAVWMGNNSVYACLQWALARVGAVLVTLNPGYSLPELVSALELSGSKALFCTRTIRKVDALQLLATALPSLTSSSPHSLHDPALPRLRSVVVVGNDDDGMGRRDTNRMVDGFKGVVDYRSIGRRDVGSGERERLSRREGEPQNGDVINLQFTSGTTGLPKAVSLTHRNILNNGKLIGECMKLTPSDVLCNPPPLFHCFGLVLGNLAAWTHGSCVVYPSEFFSPSATLRAVVEERCTALHGVPTMFIAELSLIEQVESGKSVPGLDGLELNFDSLRTGIAAGSPVPIEIMRKLMDKMNLKEQTVAYGMTETSPVSFQTRTDDPVEKRTDTVGRIHPHVKAKIVDPQDPLARPLPVKSPGELLVAGYLVQKGYWQNEDETGKVIRRDEDGTEWMCTGDEAVMDDLGYVSIVGRIKDLIIRGGENIFPVPLENVVLKLVGVSDASVIGVPDQLYGETVGVFIRRNTSIPEGFTLTIEDIQEHVRRHSKRESVPTWVWFLGEDGVIDEFPTTASGKIRKVDLRRIAKQLAIR